MMTKATLYTCLLLLTLLPGRAQRLDTIHYQGPTDNRINFVIMGDGYRAGEADKFRADARKFTEALFAETPFREYAAYFNVFAIAVASNESGADHPGTATDVSEPVHPVVDVDNHFGSSFDYFRIHRLLIPARTNRVYELLADVFPHYDQVVLLVNSPHYGGSGGSLSVASTDASATEVAIHEIGHSFGLLEDEYWAGDVYANEAANMTQETQLGAVRWKNWHGHDEVGLYQHCCGGSADRWYKPHQGCKMEVLGRPFCAVCREALIERIHQYVTPIDGYLPTSNTVFATYPTLPFSVDLVGPQPFTLRRQWTLNGQPLASGTDSLTLDRALLLGGDNDLSVWIEDTTASLRVDQHADVHLYAVSWIIKNNVTGVVTRPGQPERIELHLFPNPTTDQLQLSVRGATARPLTLRLLTLDGQEVLRQAYPPVNIHQHTLLLTELAAAPYLLELELDGYRVVRRIVKQ